MGNTETTPKFKESSALGECDKGYLSEALQIGAAERGPVERESPVRRTPARTLGRALVPGVSVEKGQLGRIHAFRGG